MMMMVVIDKLVDMDSPLGIMVSVLKDIGFKKRMQVSMATQRMVTNWHCRIKKLVDILINPNNCWPIVVTGGK